MATKKSYNEQLLLKKVASGDGQAFRVIYDAYFDRVSAFAYKISKSDTISAEIVQDVFMKLWTNRQSLQDVLSLEAYIFSITRNKAIDHLRQLARETTLIQALASQTAIGYNPIDDKVHAEELKLLIEEALGQLSEQKRKIFKLSKYDGYSHDDIALQMQLSKSTVKNHLSETLKHLRQQISEHPGTGYLQVLFFFLFFY